MLKKSVREFVSEIARLATLNVAVVVDDYPLVSPKDRHRGKCGCLHPAETFDSSRAVACERSKFPDGYRKVLSQLPGTQRRNRTEMELAAHLLGNVVRLGLETTAEGDRQGTASLRMRS
jgi:hypothetical protein